MKNLLFLLNWFGLGWTEKTAQIYFKYLRNNYNLFIGWINNWWDRYDEFLKYAKKWQLFNWKYERIENFINDNKIDIVFLHWIPQNNEKFALFLYNLKNKIKDLKIFETCQFSTYSDLDKYLDWKLFPSKTSLIKFLVNFKSPKDTKYSYIYNPIDIEDLSQKILWNEEKFLLRKQYWIWKDDFVIWKVWRADVVKWDDMIIDVVPLLKDKIKNLKIVIRSLPKFKMKKIKKLGIEKYFVLLPETVDEKEIANTYQLMDVMVHTSRIWESFWVALVEWMFFWLPILTTSTDWSQWLFFDKDNSQYEILWEHNQKFISNDKNYIAEEIFKFYNNPSLLKDIWNKNREFCLKYHAKSQLEKLISILEWTYKNRNIHDLNEEFLNYKKHCIKESLHYRLYYGIKWIYEMTFKNNFPF